MFGFEFIRSLWTRTLQGAALETAEAVTHFASVQDAAQTAGTLTIRTGAPPSLIDRMIHFRLQASPVDTQLFFLFGRSGSVMPHFHAQVVQFSPDACVFNADFLPRLDAVDHPGYFREVFGPVTKAYWRAINDTNNICALAPANPAIAAYLSPWSIGCGRPTNHDELRRVTPQIEAFLDHYLHLAGGIDYRGLTAGELTDRDRRHLELFFADELDPRAWKGVYGVIGEAAGLAVKRAFQTELRTQD